MLKLSHDSHRPSLTFSIQKVYKIHRVVMLQPQCDYCEMFWKVVFYVNRGYFDILYAYLWLYSYQEWLIKCFFVVEWQIMLKTKLLGLRIFTISCCSIWLASNIIYKRYHFCRFSNPTHFVPYSFNQNTR
jgi:hypothetical protein